MSALLAELAQGLLEAVLPTRCAGCDRLSGEPFCHGCQTSLVPAPPFALSGLSWAAACFEYGGALSEAIARLKYEGREDVGRVLAPLLASHPVPEVDIVVPVPLSRRRLIRRGFNQAEILSRAFASSRAPSVLRRRLDAPPQAQSSREARLKNVAAAFVVDRPDRVRGRRILLIDDVVTTGATARSAASALDRAGAASVGLLVLARADWGTDRPPRSSI